MEKNRGRKLRGKGDRKPDLTRREFLKKTGTIALVGIASTGPFFLRGPKAYGAEMTLEELTKGKVHPGDRITKDNVHLVKDLIAESTYSKVQRGFEIEIESGPMTPKTDIRDPFYWEVTERNKGKAVLDKDGNLRTRDGKNWIGGLPFPEPKTGTEVIYNLLERVMSGDDFAFHTLEIWINSKGVVYNTSRSVWTAITLRGRTMVPPLGDYPGYEKEFSRSVVYYLKPFDIRGLAVLIFRYNDMRKLDDMYGYLPALRRTRRLSTTQRDDSVNGNDVVMCDYNGFDDPVLSWNCKILAKKQMLVMGYKNVIQKDETSWLNAPRYAGKFFKCKHELRPVYMIEATPVTKRAYSKKIVYVDAESFLLRIGEGYDHAGKLWRSTERGDAPAPPGGEGVGKLKFSHSWNVQAYDHQSDSITHLVASPEDQINAGYKPNDYWDVAKLTSFGAK